MKRDCVAILSIIILDMVRKGHCEITNLRAVTYFSALDEYYYSLLKQNPLPPKPLELSESSERSEWYEPSSSSSSSVQAVDDAIVKKKLCRKIFTSVHFEKKLREWVDVDDQTVLVHSYEKNPTLFNRILPASTAGPSGVPRYTNPYRFYSFLYDLKTEYDLMFVCPVLKTKTDEIQPYYVTREYNVNLVANGTPIVGRFVFRKDRAKDIVIEALAEEPAVGSTVKHKLRPIAESEYIERRQFNLQRGAPQEVDPVCKLTPSNKLRLCASIFASKVLRFKYKFTPSLENVQPEDCRKVRVSFDTRTYAQMLSKSVRTFADKARVYDEWMIGCRALRIVGESKNHQPVTYYVSRGYAKNTAFTFKEKYNDGRIFVKHFMRNVSVVDGLAADEIGRRTIN